MGWLQRLRDRRAGHESAAEPEYPPGTGPEYWGPINEAVEAFRSRGNVLSEASCVSFFRYKFPETFGEVRYLLIKGTSPRAIRYAVEDNGASKLAAGMVEAMACSELRSMY